MEGKTWLFNGHLAGSSAPVVEMWGTKKDDSFYASQIVAHRQGKGFGSELLKYTIARFKELNLKRVECYVVASNADSRNMLRKAGFIEDRETKDGSYWVLPL